jgi:hypothetical protein
MVGASPFQGSAAAFAAQVVKAADFCNPGWSLRGRDHWVPHLLSGGGSDTLNQKRTHLSPRDLTMSNPERLPVHIRNTDGAYLACIGGEWEFTADRSLAYIFDYHEDEVRSQLDEAYRDFAVLWSVAPVDPHQASEVFDGGDL